MSSNINNLRTDLTPFERKWVREAIKVLSPQTTKENLRKIRSMAESQPGFSKKAIDSLISQVKERQEIAYILGMIPKKFAYSSDFTFLVEGALTGDISFDEIIEDEQIRRAIAIDLVYINPGLCAKYIHKFAIKSEEDKTLIFCYIARVAPNEFYQYFPTFGITEPSDIANLLPRLMDRHPELHEGCLNRLGITDPRFIAKMARCLIELTQPENMKTLRVFEILGISDLASIKEIILLLAHEDPRFCAEHFSTFVLLKDDPDRYNFHNTPDEEDTAELTEDQKFNRDYADFCMDVARIIAEKDPKACADNFNNFIGIVKSSPYGFRNLSKTVIESGIPKIIVETAPEAFLANFYDFYLFYRTEEVEKLFKIITDRNPEFTKAGIIKTIATHAPHLCASYFPYLKYENETRQDQNNLIEIVTIIAKKAPKEVLDYFSKFGLKNETREDQEAILAIVKIIIDNMPEEDTFSTQLYAEKCLEKFPTFGLKNETDEDQNTLLQFAAIILKKAPIMFTKKFSVFGIRNVTDKDEKAIMQLAEMAIDLKSWETANNLTNFGIKDESRRLDLARRIGNRSPCAYLAHFKNFKVEDQRLEFMEKYVQQDPVGFNMHGSTYLKQISLDESTKLKFALLAAKGDNFGECIGLYHLSIDQLFLVALEYAEHNSDNISTLIRNFSLMQFSEERRFAIARRAQKIHSLSHIEMYNLPTYKFKIACLCVSRVRTLQELNDVFTHTSTMHMSNSNLDYTPEQKRCLNAKALLALSLNEEEFNKADLKKIFHDQKLDYPEDFLPSIAEQIDKLPPDQDHIRRRQKVWMAYVYAYSQMLSENSTSVKEFERFLSELANYKNPKLRLLLTETFLENYSQFKPTDLPCESNNQTRVSIFKVIRASFLSNNVIYDEVFTKYIDAFIQNNNFKDAARQQLLFNFLHLLQEESTLSSEEKERLLRIIFQIPETGKDKGKVDAISACELMAVCTDLILFNLQKTLLVHVSKPLEKIPDREVIIGELKNEIRDMFVKSFNIELNGDFYKKYSTFTREFRKVRHLFRYSANLQSSFDSKGPILTTLNLFVQEILDGTFQKNRYENSEHLNTALSDPKVKEAWTTPLAPTPVTLAENQMQTTEPDFRPFLKYKITIENHLGNDYKKSYPHLHAVLKQGKAPQTAQKEIKDKIDELLLQIGKNPKTEASLASQLDILKREANLVDLLLPAKGKEGRQAQLQVLRAQYADNLEFQGDINQLLDFYATGGSLTSVLTVHDSDKAADLFLCGDEVNGSCQRTDGSPHNNQALMGYVLDGKYRIMCIKNQQGEMIARCMMRLVIDEVTKKPVLMQERIYVRNTNPALPIALQNACIEKAKAMGIPLVSYEGTNGIRTYKNTLVSLSCRASAEYVDASHLGVVKGGKYQFVIRPMVVYDPTPIPVGSTEPPINIIPVAASMVAVSA